MSELFYVYILRCRDHSYYVGATSNLKERLKAHNEGKSSHTAQYMPWRVCVAMYFDDDAKADEFERYLKSASGRGFAERHLW